MENLMQDIRFALRTFLKNPGFAAIAIITLALGIGANTTRTVKIDSVLLRTLPVSNPQQLVLLTCATTTTFSPASSQQTALFQSCK